MLKPTIILLSCICVAFAGLLGGRPDPKPKKFEGVPGCYIKELDAVIPNGHSAPSNTYCKEYKCQGDFVVQASCISTRAHPPCYTVEDKSKPYPGCCKQIRCN